MQVDHYAVFGNPIAHSLSPFIHHYFAQHSRQTMKYEAILALQESFTHTIKTFFSQGGKGCNITAPFKEQAYTLCTLHTERALKAQAVNTIKATPQGLLGDNTDGVGILRDVQHHLDLSGQHILIIGAGGATKGILFPLIQSKPASITIANRTVEKAQLLCQYFQHEEVELSAISLSQLSLYQPTLLIHATSNREFSSHLTLPAALLHKVEMAYDLNYGKEMSFFLSQAQAANVPFVLDGLGMLIYQAAEAFYLWRGIFPECHPLFSLLRTQLAKSSS